MTSIFNRARGAPWRRTQRFELSPAGIEAEAAYRAVLEVSHEEGGRVAFDRGTEVWAASLGIRAGDGAYLSELRSSSLTLAELTQGFESAGVSSGELKPAVERLITAKLIDLVPP